MADYRFSFMNLSKIESPNWMAPEGISYHRLLTNGYVRMFYLLSDTSLDLYFVCFFIVLQKSPEEVDQRSADMWSYAMILWELVTREVPFGDLSPMEVGMKVIFLSIISVDK